MYVRGEKIVKGKMCEKKLYFHLFSPHKNVWNDAIQKKKTIIM